MSTTRRRGIGIVLGVLLAMLVVLPAKPALATTADDPYNFTFWGTGATQGRNGQRKDNQTETFIAINSINMSRVNFYVDGSTSQWGPWLNRTRGGVAVGYYTGYFIIHNYVYENGERWARLTAMSPEGSGSAKGYWSPDTNESWRPSLN